MWRPSLGLLAVAVGIVAGSLAAWWASRPTVAPLAPAAPPSAAAARAAAPATPAAVALASGPPAVAAGPIVAVAGAAPGIRRDRDPDGDQTPDLSDYINPGERPSMGEVIERLHRAGVHSGLGAFSPPGTRPPLVGLAVPQEFELPPGYVRHHQVTDDGRRIEPILMFAPGHQLLDAAGRPLAMPADRVVPPELAPPGLPLRRITIPAPAEGWAAAR